MFEGWKNHLLPSQDMKNQIDSTSKERLEICKACDLIDYTGKGCVLPGLGACCDKRKFGTRIDNGEIEMGCGCTLSAKIACLSCECPLKKWTAQLTKEEELTLKDI